MSRVLPIVSLFVLVMAGCTQSSGKQGPAAVSDLQAAADSLFDGYVDALNRSDSTGVLQAFGPGDGVTVAGRERFFRGSMAVSHNAGEGVLSMGQNTFEIDTVDVVPVEKEHALAMVIYTVDPSDQDVPAFHTTGTYLLQRIGNRWKIVHAHVCPAREL